MLVARYLELLDPSMEPSGIAKRTASSPPNKENKKSKDDECVVCFKPATNDILECVWCEGRQHRSCSQISVDVCNVLSNVVTNIVFFCTSCLKMLPVALKCFDCQSVIDSKVTSIDKSLLEIQQSEKRLCELINKVETQLADHHKSMDSMLTGHVTGLAKASGSVNANAPISPDSVEHIAISLVSEQKEKERRQLNLIVHKLEESSANDGPSRKNDDIKRCESLFQTYLGIKVSITNAFRLGQKSDKPRLLKLFLSNLHEKAEILKNKYKLRDSTNPQHIRETFITPDLTPLEQKTNKELRNKLADMNKAENIYIIKNGKIVRRQT